ncbi:PmoA family protein [Luteolibacter pohnpeiensis]|uniref:PmoA family protein n=1 Tax=Luteolibacter pohnpeiensis TaxID=454153 RepID=A0A934VW72_9BACT|nr:PmoA family protein [Luteolibacter pohnpeiensis]MBK1882518.1 PmoA family protein [Luteolibacter pohnpeiensis]
MKWMILLWGLASGFAGAELKVEKSEGTLKIFDDGSLLTAYRTDWKVPYLYPLLSPSGANVTRHWPTDPGVEGEEHDHPHHRSLWLSHGSVNGYDFWAFEDGKGAQIVHQKFIAQGVDEQGAAYCSVELAWQAGGKTQLKEKRDHRFWKIGEDTFALQIDSELTAADGDVVFGDTKEGMLGLRVDRSLRLNGPLAKSHIINSEGIEDGKAWGKRANWVAAYGPDERGEPAVIAMFDHPSNLRHPTWWHARDYGLFAANPFGKHDFEGNPDKTVGNYTLKQGKSLKFRFLVFIHHGDLQSADLPAVWTLFSKF